MFISLLHQYKIIDVWTEHEYDNYVGVQSGSKGVKLNFGGHNQSTNLTLERKISHEGSEIDFGTHEDDEPIDSEDDNVILDE